MQHLYILLIALFANSILCDDETFSVQLNPSNFEAEITDRNYLVVFHYPDCERSQRFVSKYEQLAKSLNVDDDLRLGSVNCAEHKDLCVSQGVTALEVILYRSGEENVKFHGVKSEEGIAKFLVKFLGDNILDNKIDVPESFNALNELTSETFHDHVAVGNHFVKFYAPWCGHCQHLAPTWSELASALEFDSTVSISKVDCTVDRPICQEFEVKGYPTLLWIENGKKIEKYSGSRSLEEFKSFIERKIGAQTNEVPKPAVDIDGHQEENSVARLTGNSFEHAIEKGVTIVKFFAPWCGHCKRLAPTWDDLATKFIGNLSVKVAKVDCTLSDNKDLCSSQDVDGFPTIFLYKNGDKVTEYNGNRSLDDLVNFVNRYRGDHDEL